jgi:hypothetical protein
MTASLVAVADPAALAADVARAAGCPLYSDLPTLLDVGQARRRDPRDAQRAACRGRAAVHRAQRAGRWSEKPVADTLEEAVRLAEAESRQPRAAARGPSTAATAACSKPRAR